MSPKSSTPVPDTGSVSSRIMRPDHDVVIIGAGFSGVGAAIELDQAGFPDFVVVDRNERIGGVRGANTFPDAGGHGHERRGSVAEHDLCARRLPVLFRREHLTT